MAIAEKLNYLLETKNQIKNALINKGSEISDTESFRSYANKINSIKVGTDTSDATAVAGDILAGKTAYVNDEKITGTMNKGDFINGIIQEAKAQGVVTAGDFVRFLSDYSESNKSSDTAINTTVGTGRAISAVELDENRVFIAYFHPSGVSGIICTIQGCTITKGTHTILHSGSNIGLTVSAVALNANKVFVSYSYGSSAYLYGIICTIQGSTITIGTSTQIGTTNTSKVISAVKLDEGKVFIAHSYESKYHLYGIVCTISGTMITKGSDTLLSTITDSGSSISAVKLDEGKVFIAFRTSDGRLNSVLCTVLEKAITTQNTKILSANEETYSGRVISMIALSENKVFIAHSYSSDYHLHGMVCTMSGITITKGNDTALNSTSGTGKVISAVALNENTVNILHSDSNNYLYSMLCDISGTTVTKKSDTQINSTVDSVTVISAVALNEKDTFIAHNKGANPCLYGMFLGYLENFVKTITSSTKKIGGIAISDGTSGQTVQVKKPM